MTQENSKLRMAVWVWVIVALAAFFFGAYQVYASANPQGGSNDYPVASSGGDQCSGSSLGSSCGVSSVCGPNRLVNYSCRATAQGNRIIGSCGGPCGNQPSPAPAPTPSPTPTPNNGGNAAYTPTQTCTPAAPAPIEKFNPLENVAINADGSFSLNWEANARIGGGCGVVPREAYAIRVAELPTSGTCKQAKGLRYKWLFVTVDRAGVFTDQKSPLYGYTTKVTKNSIANVKPTRNTYSMVVSPISPKPARSFVVEKGKSYCAQVFRGNTKANKILNTTISFAN